MPTCLIHTCIKMYVNLSLDVFGFAILYIHWITLYYYSFDDSSIFYLICCSIRNPLSHCGTIWYQKCSVTKHSPHDGKVLSTWRQSALNLFNMHSYFHMHAALLCIRRQTSSGPAMHLYIPRTLSAYVYIYFKIYIFLFQINYKYIFLLFIWKQTHMKNSRTRFFAFPESNSGQ